MWVPGFEDYEKAIMEKLKQIRIPDENGNLVPITVSYYMPEPENDSDLNYKRPAIVFFLYNMTPDTTKFSTVTQQVVSNTTSTVTLEDVPTPTKLFYQFNIITEYKIHENLIIQQFNQIFKHRGYIAVDSPEGEQLAYDFFQRSFENGDTNQAVPQGGTVFERIFRKIYKYVLHGEIGMNDMSEYPIVTSPPNINLSEKEG